MNKIHIRLGSQGAHAFLPKCQTRSNLTYIGIGSCLHPTDFAKTDEKEQCAHCLKLLLKARAKRNS